MAARRGLSTVVPRRLNGAALGKTNGVIPTNFASVKNVDHEHSAASPAVQAEGKHPLGPRAGFGFSGLEAMLLAKHPLGPRAGYGFLVFEAMLRRQGSDVPTLSAAMEVDEWIGRRAALAHPGLPPCRLCSGEVPRAAGLPPCRLCSAREASASAAVQTPPIKASASPNLPPCRLCSGGSPRAAGLPPCRLCASRV